MKISKEIEVTLPNEVVTEYNAHVGCKVMRGPDWGYNDYDGGAGSIGIIHSVLIGGWVLVQWSNNKHATYRIGYRDKYDLIFTR